MSDQNIPVTVANQVSEMSKDWSDFKGEYKSLKKQVDSLNAALARPNFDDSKQISDLEKKAYSDYLRRGEISLELKDKFSEADGEGGGLVIPHLASQIAVGLQSISPMRHLANVVTIASNRLDIVSEKGNFTCGWVGEKGDRADTNAPGLEVKQIPVHELYAQPLATQRLIDDSVLDIGSWLQNRLTEYFAKQEGIAFISGDGNDKPRGILAADTGIEVVKTKEEHKLVLGDLMELVNRLPQAYMANAAFLMHRSILSYIQSMRDETGRFIWQPAHMNLGKQQTLLGIPVYCSEDMPVKTGAEGEARKPIIALGDFKRGYTIVDRSGIGVTRDPYTSKPYVKFYAVKRVGGGVVRSDAIKLLEC